MTDTSDAVEETCAGALWRGASEDRECSKDSGSKQQRGQEVSASGALQDGCAAW